jgi:uncharacterized protein (TIRG00374 family)
MTASNRLRDPRLWIGIGISAFFLYLLFRKIDPRELAAAFRSMDWRYLIPAVALTFLSYFLRAIRWKYLLLPLKRTSMGNLFPATVIGYMANNLLPARLGEFVRAYVLGQREGIETGSVFATLVVDRLWDGFTVLLILLATLFTLRLPPGMEDVQRAMHTGGYATLLLYLGVIAFLVLLKHRTAWTIRIVGKVMGPFPAALQEKVIRLLGAFIQGVRLPAGAGNIAALCLSSLAIWTAAVWPIDLLLQAFGIHLPVSASLFIMVFLVFAVMVPASPGYVGTYHYACVTALQAFNISDERALSVALVIHGVGFFPVIVLGFYYLVRDRISLKEAEELSAKEGHSRA